MVTSAPDWKERFTAFQAKIRPQLLRQRRHSPASRGVARRVVDHDVKGHPIYADDVRPPSEGPL